MSVAVGMAQPRRATGSANQANSRNLAAEPSGFAALLNTSLSPVQKREIGQKRPTGTALKLLHLGQMRGLEVVARNLVAVAGTDAVFGPPAPVVSCAHEA